MGDGCPVFNAFTATSCLEGAVSTRYQKSLASASSQGQMDLVGVPRQMRCLRGPLGSGGPKDALVATKEDAEREESADTREDWEAF